MEFRDFVVEILATRDGRFDLRASSQASGELQASVALGRSVDDLLAMVDAGAVGARAAGAERAFTPESAVPLDTRAEEVGQVLFDMLFSEPELSRALGECMTNAKMAQAGVRLKLTLNTRDAGVANLARLPWELLHDDSKYKHFGLRNDFPIVRYLEVPKDIAVAPFTPPLRILAVSANPRHDLSLDRERDNLWTALGANADIALTFVEQATIQGVADALTRARAAGESIHVVHYMGHGDFHHGQGVLLLHKEGGGEDLVDAEAFARTLQRASDVRLVFLNACNTAQSASTAASDPFSGVAASLVFEGIPAVVAMQRPVPDAAAIVLAKHFYAGIATGLPVDAAMSEGRLQMFLAKRDGLDWAIPVLFMRTKDGVLFPSPPDGPKSGTRRPLWIGGALVVLLGAALATYFTLSRSVPSRAPIDEWAASVAVEPNPSTTTATTAVVPGGGGGQTPAVVVPAPPPAVDAAALPGGGIDMVRVESGTFDMGSPSGERGRSTNEGPVHRVSINAFELGRFEVTVEQFEDYVNANPTLALDGCHAYKGTWVLDTAANWKSPGFPQSPTSPVVCVSWLDARAYVAWLNTTHATDAYRLPSESEWEYAARAGTNGPRYWSNADDTCDYAVSTFESASCVAERGRTRDVGRKRDNGFHLRDMLGNASEWTADCWNGAYSRAPSDGEPWTTGQCDFRVVRGASWYHGLDRLRTAFRDRFNPRFRSNQIGFRVAKTLGVTR